MISTLALALLLVAARPAARPYLGLPSEAEGEPPALLSGTGAFDDVRSLRPSAALIPYELIAPFWSDGAEKSRWVSLPNDPTTGPTRIGVGADGDWSFPAGTVFVKHFEIRLDEARPESRRRLETRLLVRGASGGVRGVSYRWRPDGSDADLVRSAQLEPLAIDSPRGRRAQTWTYPGPADCRQCHTPASGGVLGVGARQLNRDGPGASANQIRAWRDMGLFESPPTDAEIARARLAGFDDPGRPIEDRARSYLDANCAQCHRPGGVAADFDARFSTPLPDQRLIGAPARINLGVDGARLVAPNDPWRSTLLARVETLEATRMPPLAHEVVDARGAELLRAWIATLPGPSVVAPPAIRPRGGEPTGPIRVTLDHPDPAATIRYTLDGSAPGPASAAYAGPFEVRESTTLRARAYRAGSTRSVVVQETWSFDPVPVSEPPGPPRSPTVPPRP